MMSNSAYLSGELWTNRLARYLDAHRSVIAIGLVGLMLLGFNARWLPGPDSGLYLTLARNLAEGRDFTYQGAPSVMGYPGFPLLASSLFRLFGTDTLVPLHVVILLMALTSLALTYRLIALSMDRPTAIVVTAMVATSNLFYRHSFMLLTDLPFLLSVMAVLCGYEAIAHHRARGYDWVLLGMGLIIAAFTRPFAIPLAAAILLVCGLRAAQRQRIAAHLTVAALVIAAMACFYLLDPRANVIASAGSYEKSALNAIFSITPMIQRLFGDTLPKLLGEYTTEAALGLELGPGLNSIFSVVMVTLLLLLVRRNLLWGWWAALAMMTMVVLVIVPRYFLPVLPLMALAWWRLTCLVGVRLPRPWNARIAAVLLMLWIVPNLVKIRSFVSEQWQYRVTGIDHLDRYQLIARFINDHTEPIDLVATNKWVPELTYLTGRNIRSDRDLMHGNRLSDWVHTTSASDCFVVLLPKKHQLTPWTSEGPLMLGPVVASLNIDGGSSVVVLRKVLIRQAAVDE